MTIAEKILRAKADYDAVYEAGKNSGGGADSYYDTLWDVQQNYGDSAGVNYMYAYSHRKFTDETYNPKYDIICSNGTSSGTAIFYSNKYITDTKVPIRILGTSAQSAFYSCTNLRRIVLLQVHEGVAFQTTFSACEALEEINIEGVIGKTISFGASSKLNKPSIISIMNALSATTSGLTITFSKKAVDKAFETTEGANDGSSSAEWDALGGTNRVRQNWTVSLV